MKRTTDKLCRLSMIATGIFAFIGYASAQNGGGGGETKLITAVACYLGTSGRIDRIRAHKLFIDAGRENDPLAQMWLARCCFTGRAGFTKDEQKAQDRAKDVIKSIEKMARDGNAHAMALWASALDEGLGVAVDPTQSMSWYRKAAEQGDVLAMKNLGDAYYKADDMKQAETWFQRAAAAGHPSAMCDLGFLNLEKEMLLDVLTEGDKTLFASAKRLIADSKKQLGL
jgi:TPR repeat protein